MEKKINKKNVVEKKSVIKKKIKINKNKKIDSEKLFTTERVLLGIFIILAIFVCILGCLVISKRNKDRVIDKTNIVIPILELNTKDTIEIDAYGLTKERFYIIKVTNYYGKKLLEEDLEYTIDVENDTKATIKLTKNDDETNLIKNNKKTFITGQELLKNKKQEDYYYLSIVHDGGVTKKDVIKITLNASNDELVAEEKVN